MPAVGSYRSLSNSTCSPLELSASTLTFSYPSSEFATEPVGLRARGLVNLRLRSR
jgi:hypothetical protein